MRYAKVNEALQLAAKLHSGEERDGDNPLPYITHPVEVLLNLRYTGGVTDEDLLVAAALHDVVESTGHPFADIETRFGKRACDLVRELTRKEPSREETAGMTKDEIWQLRAGMLVVEIERMSADGQRVKLADRLANLREAFLTKKSAKLDRYRSQTEKILSVIPRAVNAPLWDAIQLEIKRRR